MDDTLEQGRWLDRGWEIVCPDCGAELNDEILWITDGYPHFCPCCGSDMEVV